MKGTLYLVNRAHPLPEEPAAEDLASVRSGQTEVRLHQRAKVMLDQLLAAVDGAGTIIPVSGYRPQTEQQAIWDDTLEREGEDFTRKYVALPGCSEHQTGLAIDLGEAAGEIDFIRPRFPEDGVCGAFRRAAAGYGFIQRYRREKEAVTTIAEEPWHFRYVGAPHAALMEENGLCLEEYRDFVAEQPRRCALAGGRAATVSWLPCPAEGLELPEPEGCWQISGDNAGGFFLTVWEHLL